MYISNIDKEDNVYMGNEYKKIISDKKIEAGRLMSNKQVSDCNIAIHTASAAAAAGGAIPLPGVDAVPISAAQLAMVFALGKIFNQKVTESAAKGLIGAAASTFVGRNLVKLIPIVGWGVSAVVAAGVTEAIGWSIAVDFAKSYKKDAENLNAEIRRTIEKTEEEIRAEELRQAREVYDKAFAEESREINLKAYGDGMEDDSVVNDAENNEYTEDIRAEEDLDDESISQDFAKAFGEEDE